MNLLFVPRQTPINLLSLIKLLLLTTILKPLGSFLLQSLLSYTTPFPTLLILINPPTHNGTYTDEIEALSSLDYPFGAHIPQLLHFGSNAAHSAITCSYVNQSPCTDSNSNPQMLFLCLFFCY